MGLLQIALDERQVLTQDGDVDVAHEPRQEADVRAAAQTVEDEGAPMRRHFRLILLMVDPVQGSQANARTRSTCREIEYSLAKPPTPPHAVVSLAVQPCAATRAAHRGRNLRHLARPAS